MRPPRASRWTTGGRRGSGGLPEVCLHDIRGYSRRPFPTCIARDDGVWVRSIRAAGLGAAMKHPREWLQPNVGRIGRSPRTSEGRAIIASGTAIGTMVGRSQSEGAVLHAPTDPA